MGWCNKDVTPLLMHWSYVYFALTRRYVDFILQQKRTLKNIIKRVLYSEGHWGGDASLRIPTFMDTAYAMLCFVVVGYRPIIHYSMMTSSSGSIFRGTGHLCREFTGHGWIPLTKASDAGLWWVFFICVWTNGWVNNRWAGDLRRYRVNYDVAVMSSTLLYWHRVNLAISPIPVRQPWRIRVNKSRLFTQNW